MHVRRNGGVPEGAGLTGGGLPGRQGGPAGSPRLGSKRRDRLRSLLQREELKDAIMTRLQVDAPRACGAAELQGVVEAQVDRLMSEGILTTAGRVGGGGKGRARSAGLRRTNLRELCSPRPMTPQGRDLQAVAKQVRSTGGSAGSGNNGAAAATQPASGPASARSASPSRRTVKVKLPTYSLGGKRVSLETLLREKINQRTRGGANLLLRQFRELDADLSGSIDKQELSEFLGQYNIRLESAVLDNVMRKYDKDGDGSIDYTEFAKNVLPEDFPSANEPAYKGFQLKSQESPQKPKPHSKPNPDNQWSAAGRPSRTVESIEELLRNKIAERQAGGTTSLTGLRRAFRHFDQNDSGSITTRQVREVLDKFNVYVSEDEFRSFMGKYDGLGSGSVTYEDFSRTLMPTDQQVADRHAKRTHAGVRAGVDRRLKAMDRVFRSYTQEGPDQGVSVAEVHQMLGAEGLKLDAMTSQQLEVAAAGGKVTHAEFRQALLAAKEDVISSEVAKRAPKGMLEGFGNNHRSGRKTAESQRKGPNSAASYSGPALPARVVESVLRQKLAQRAHGGAALRRAFLELDGERAGLVTSADLQQVLLRFNVNVLPGEMQELCRKYTKGDSTDDVVDYREFLSEVTLSDYPSKAEDMRKHAVGGIQGGLARAAAALRGVRARGGTVPAAMAEQAFLRSGLNIPKAELQTILADCAERGAVDYEEVLQKVQSRAVQIAERGVEVAIEAKPKGVYEALTSGEAGYKPRKPAREPTFQQHITSEKLEQLIKDKVQQRCKGGASELRYAFKHFDKDGSGDITYQEFEQALSMFNLKVSGEDLGPLLRAYDPEGSGHINFVNFVNRMMPPDTFDITKQSALVSVRKNIQASFETLREQLGNAAGGTGQVPLSDLLEACKALGIALDDKMVHRIQQRAGTNAEGANVNWSDLASFVESHQLQALDAQVSHEARTRLYSPTPKFDNMVLEEVDIDVPEDGGAWPSNYEDYQAAGPVDMWQSPASRPATPSHTLLRELDAGLDTIERDMAPSRPATSQGGPGSDGTARRLLRPRSASSSRPPSSAGAPQQRRRPQSAHASSRPSTAASSLGGASAVSLQGYPSPSSQPTPRGQMHVNHLLEKRQQRSRPSSAASSVAAKRAGGGTKGAGPARPRSAPQSRGGTPPRQVRAVGDSWGAGRPPSAHKGNGGVSLRMGRTPRPASGRQDLNPYLAVQGMAMNIK